MRVALSVDMEGASQLRGVREIFGCLPEYWATGKAALEADAVAACEGLLAGGATEIIVLDNHGGNTVNVSPDVLPAPARLETWNVYDLRDHGVDAMFQLGYHARGGVDGFLSHTYLPGLRLRAAHEPISESHGRAWAGEVPLLGIVGNDTHRETLGTLERTPYLVVQQSRGRDAMEPVFAEPRDGLDAIRDFAHDCVAASAAAPAVQAPRRVTFEASMPNGRDAADTLAAAGWNRIGEVEFAIELDSWRESREPLAAAMNAALAPFLPYWLSGFADADEAAAADPGRVEKLRRIFDAWAAESQPEWYTEPAEPLPAAVAGHLDR